MRLARLIAEINRKREVRAGLVPVGAYVCEGTSSWRSGGLAAGVADGLS
jgi:hypothetical protein